MIPTTEVALLLRGWKDSKRRLRVVARLNGVDFSGFCRVFDATEDGFALIIGGDERDMIGFLFEGWGFDFGDAPPNDDSMVMGEPAESVIVGAKGASSLFMMLLAG